jgi:HPt (histidine-containing phosphotransfer) domain-containing protein/two-component sensor histidine kinase
MKLAQILSYIVLPAELTAFERTYLARMNKIALGFFALHVPQMAAVAYFNHTGPGLAVVLTLLAIAGPLLAMELFKNPRHVSMVFGVTAMLMGALLVHFGRGLWTIEMHFYFFVALALLAVFANPLVIVAAAATVTLHHLVLWFVAPQSVFNYDAPLSSVLVHAAFVVVESVAAVFVARSFFDNVIGLERIVAARTGQLDAKNREMTLVFDHVQQGFLTAGPDGRLSAQHSRVVEQWLTTPVADEPAWAFFSRVDATFAQWLEVGWGALTDDVFPRKVALAQLPVRLAAGGRNLEVSYQPIERDGKLEQVLVLVSDVTSRVERERAELEQRELMQVFERLQRDRSAFLDFLAESREQIDALAVEPCTLPDTVQLRLVHTLKGNCALFGVASVAQVCHEVETAVAEQGGGVRPVDRARVAQAWSGSSARMRRFLGEGRRAIELDEGDFVAIVKAIDEGAPRVDIRRLVESWRLEPVKRRFERLADQARALMQRQGKGAIDVEIEANDVRLPRESMARFWSTMVHVVRNAVDHGLAQGREPKLFQSRLDGDRIVLSVSDNGQGVDWAKVGQVAVRRGLAHQTPGELEAALFHDGVSTRDEATDLSGRGMGLSAVLAAVRDLGGSVRVLSAPGQGTRFDLVLPVSVLDEGRGSLDATQQRDLKVSSSSPSRAN